MMCITYLAVAFVIGKLISSSRKKYSVQNQFNGNLENTESSFRNIIYQSMISLKKSTSDLITSVHSLQSPELDSATLEMNRKLENLIHFSRPLFEKSKKTEIVSLGEAVQTVIQILNKKKQGQKLLLTIPIEPIFVEMNPDVLELLFANLLLFTQDSEPIHIIVEEQGEFGVVSLPDLSGILSKWLSTEEAESVDEWVVKDLLRTAEATAEREAKDHQPSKTFRMLFKKTHAPTFSSAP